MLVAHCVNAFIDGFPVTGLINQDIAARKWNALINKFFNPFNRDQR